LQRNKAVIGDTFVASEPFFKLDALVIARISPRSAAIDL
jgi:hypothetical protein